MKNPSCTKYLLLPLVLMLPSHPLLFPLPRIISAAALTKFHVTIHFFTTYTWVTIYLCQPYGQCIAQFPKLQPRLHKSSIVDVICHQIYILTLINLVMVLEGFWQCVKKW